MSSVTLYKYLNSLSIGFATIKWGYIYLAALIIMFTHFHLNSKSLHMLSYLDLITNI